MVGKGATDWREMVDELKDGRGRYSEVTPFEACDTHRHTTLIMEDMRASRIHHTALNGCRPKIIKEGSSCSW